jgi:hypothetical protein
MKLSEFRRLTEIVAAFGMDKFTQVMEAWQDHYGLSFEDELNSWDVAEILYWLATGIPDELSSSLEPVKVSDRIWDQKMNRVIEALQLNLSSFIPYENRQASIHTLQSVELSKHHVLFLYTGDNHYNVGVAPDKLIHICRIPGQLFKELFLSI